MKSTTLRTAFLATAMLAIAVPAAASFDPFEASRNAVRHFRLEPRIAELRALCGSDLVHHAALPARYIESLSSPHVRSTVENVCALSYTGRKVLAASVGYGLLLTKEGEGDPQLVEAIEAMLEFEPGGRPD